MLDASAQPSTSISRPANGSIGHSPSMAMTPAIENDTRQMPPKNQAAARGLSEQFGAIWIVTQLFTAGHSIREDLHDTHRSFFSATQ
jgi:hypothetical protein